MLRFICQHQLLTVEVLDVAARVHGLLLLQRHDDEQSVLEMLFNNHAPTGNRAIGTQAARSMDWLMHEGLWACNACADQPDTNPLALATRLKKIGWVEAIVDALTEKDETHPKALKQDLLHLAPGLLMTVQALFEMDLGSHAVRVLSVCGIRRVPGSTGCIPLIDPADRNAYQGTCERSECDLHDDRNGRRAAAWEQLATPMVQQTNSVIHSLLLPSRPPVLVQAEPVMFAIDGAAAADGLLAPLLKYTKNEKHNDVFSTEIVRELIEFKWQR
jgi:hypothetical protein